MKNALNRLTALGAIALALALAAPAQAAVTECFQNLNGPVGAGTTITTAGGTNYTVGANGLLCGVSPGDFGSVEKAGFVSIGTPGANTPFTTLPPFNPSLQLYDGTVTPGTAFNSTTVSTVLASTAGRAISLGGGVTIMASGTMGGATSVALECSDGTLIANWPVAELVNNVPVGLYASTAGPTLGAGLTKGCASGTSVQLSSVGSAITTTTLIYLSVPHVVQ